MGLDMLVASAVRWVALLAMAAMLGALVVDTLVVPRPIPAARARRWAVLAAVVLLIGTVGELILRTWTMTGSAWGAVATGLPTVVERTHFGRIWLVRAASIVAIAFLAARPGRGARLAALALAALVALTTALTGHLADWGDLTPSVALDWLHVLAACAWTGGVAVLAAISARAGWSPPVLTSVAARFSRVAGICLLVVLVTGIYNAWVQLPGLRALWTTDYGRILTVKIALVAVLAGLGSLNRYTVVARLDDRRRRHGPARMFRRLELILAGARPGARGRLPGRFIAFLAAEAMLALAVFAGSALLGEATPPRHAAVPGHHHVPEPTGPMRTTIAELHASGGVPRGWLFTPPAGDESNGRRLFTRLQCYACHAVAGEEFPAPTAPGPELTGMRGHHPAGYLVESILNPDAVIVEGPGYTRADGRSTMPEYPDLTLAELIDLVAYLRGL
jgi:putative copper export protein/mono/diheme cytochrome c family protein